MATTDELIMKINGEDYHADLQFIIDENLRTIAIPKDGVVLGVCGDKDINRVNFRMNRYYNGFDLSEFNIRVNYINANDEPNYFVVTDIQVDVDYIIFTWLVDAYATRYVGEVSFCVRLFTESEGKIDSQFFSTIGKVSILEGIQVDSMIPEAEVYDLITRISSDVEDKIQTKADAAIASIPDDYTTLSNDVSELKGDLDELEKSQVFIGYNLANPSEFQANKVIYGQTIVDGSGYYITGYIDVSKYVGKTIYLIGGARTANAYNSDKEFISNFGNWLESINITIGMHYIIVNIADSVTNPMITFDNTVGYYPYTESKFAKVTDLIKKETTKNNIFTVGQGFDFNTLLEAGLYSKAHPNNNFIFRVIFGVYDIIEEFKNHYGSDFFDNMQANTEWGIPCGYGETWQFSPGAIVTCNYNGNNPNVWTCFCPFFFEQGSAPYNAKFIGMRISAKDVKYIIHDESVGLIQPVVHEYINCNMTLTKENATDTWSTHCIGGGLGRATNIIIDSCEFTSINCNTNDNVSYHNTSIANSASFISIKNSYFSHGIKIIALGDSTIKTECIITNNNMLTDVIYSIPDGSQDNMNVIKWNNIIRSV